MTNTHRPLRALLWLICIYHVAFGFTANLPAPTVRAAASTLLGLNLPSEPALYQVLQPFGLYAITFGLMMGVAAWNPVKNRSLITLGVILFLLRLLQRLFNLDGIQHGLGVSAARHWATIGTVSTFALLLAWLRWQLYREMHTATSHPAATSFSSSPDDRP